MTAGVEVLRAEKRAEVRALVAPGGLLSGLVGREAAAEILADDESPFFELASERAERTHRTRRETSRA